MKNDPEARDEFETVREAEDMLRSLNKAAGYCRGPNSRASHAERIREVEKECDALRAREEKRS